MPDLVCERCRSLADSRPRLYLLLLTVFALIGYAWLLLFPGLVFAGISGIYHALFAAEHIAGSRLVAWLVTAGAAGLVCYRLYRFRPQPPEGRELDRFGHSALFKLAADQSRHYCSLGIDRIVLSGDFDVSIRKTPLCALPVWSRNTLMIGLPLMLALSDTQLECVLARRIGQFSRRYNRLVNWLYQLRDIWPAYCEQADSTGFGYQPAAWFFRGYAPLYRMLSVPAARMDELDADTYAMELFSDVEVLDAITTQAVCRQYLAQRYWPVASKLAANDCAVLERLHAGIPAVLRAGLTRETINTWLRNTLSAGEHSRDSMPSLAQRVDNIGFGEARMAALSTRSAAAEYGVSRQGK